MTNVWIEGTHIKRRHSGYEVGSVLYSPAKYNNSKVDGYANMRKIKKNDIIIHYLIDDKIFAGISVAESECRDSVYPPGDPGGREGYLIPLSGFVDFRERKEELYKEDIFERNREPLLQLLSEPREGALLYNRDLKINQGWAYITQAPLGLVKLIAEEFYSKNGHRLPYFADSPADSETAGVQKDGDADGSKNFIDFLKEKRFSYDAELIENFLLSIKVKPFVILTGGTGTGKTKLAQLYGEYVSNYRPKQKIVRTEVSVGKSDTSGGWTISQSDFTAEVPEAGRFDGEYRIVVDGEAGVGRLNMMPRIYFDRDRNIKKHMERLRAEGSKKKVELELHMGGSGEDDSENKNYRVIAVGSNWNESRHIIGFDNVISGTYNSTPALSLLLRASQDILSPYLLILDEMNLSHVERYFSDILSAMESRHCLNLHDNGDKYKIPQTVLMPDNLTIVGTVNMDETTHMFSPKVLDRANVIEFRTVGLSEYLNGSEQSYPSGDIDFLQDAMKGSEVRKKKAPEIASFLRGKDIDVDEIVRDLGFFQAALSKINLSFSFRTIDEIMRFMYVSYCYDSKDFKSKWYRYLDAQIMQKVLPKVHGNKSIEDTLIELLNYCGKKAHGSEKYAYPETRDKIGRMVELLKTQRYVSFTS